jgi:hypothetical protein
MTYDPSVHICIPNIIAYKFLLIVLRHVWEVTSVPAYKSDLFLLTVLWEILLKSWDNSDVPQVLIVKYLTANLYRTILV